jgi:dTDP-4-amino-4,6-dideoxygalactose transaminase
MTEAQGAVGRVQLQKLPHHNALRRRNAERLFAGLGRIRGLRPQTVRDFGESSYHLANALLLLEETGLTRDGFIARLKEKYGVDCRTQYAPIVPFQPYYQHKYGFKPGDFPVAEDLAARVVSLPIGPALKFPEDVDYILWAIEDCLS